MKCRECGCTNDNPCPGGCAWAKPDLCTRCAGPELVDAEAFAVGVLVCQCGQRMEPVVPPTGRDRLQELTAPPLIARPGQPGSSPEQLAAAQVLERLAVAADTYTGALGYRLAFGQLEAWACRACGRVLHVESFQPVQEADNGQPSEPNGSD